MEVSYLVQAGGLVLAGIGDALVGVQLTARPHVTSLAPTLERAFRVEALTRVLTRVGACSGYTQTNHELQDVIAGCRILFY